MDLVRLVVGGHRIVDKPAFQYFLHGILIYGKDGIALSGYPCLEFLTKCYVQERLHQYLEIEPPRAVFQIEQIVAQTAKHLLQRIRIAVVERGIRGHARTDLVQVTIAGITFHDLVDVELPFRTGT